jgi:glutathione peroxidase-family protein
VRGVAPTQWNFTKFLLVDGAPTKRYGPRDSPLTFEADIVAALADVESRPPLAE